MLPKKNALSKAVYALSIITALSGILVLIGWQFDNDALKTFGFGGVTMKVNTAISFIFIGLALIFLQKKDQKTTLYLARIFSLATLLLSALVFSQYFFNINLGIDEMLFKDAPKTVHPGRMAPNTALNFIFAGLSLILISFNKTKNSLFLVLLITSVLCISIFGVMGHLFGITVLTGLANFTKMALNTSLVFIIISIALLFTIHNDSKIIVTIERKLFAGITIAMVVILFVSVNSIMSIHSLVSASNSVHRSEVVKSELNKINTEAYGMVADTRGFLISNNEKFIADWNQSKTDILKSAKNLEALTKDDPTQQKILNTLNQLLKERIEFSELSIQAQKTESPEASKVSFATLKGRQILNKISAAISKMMEEENRLLKLRIENEINNSDQVLTIIALNVFFQLILLTLIFLFVSKDLTGKRKAQKELQTLLENWEELVEERSSELITSNKKIIIERDKANQYLDIAGVLLVLLDKTGKVSKINKKGCEVLGYAENEIVGKDYFETFLPKNIADESRVIYKGLMNGSIEAIEFYENPVLNKNGEERIIEWHNVILRDANGNPNGTLSSGEDITKRKLAEEKILKLNEELELKVEERTEQLKDTNENLFKEIVEHKKTEERIRLIVESAPNALILVGSNGKIQLINKQTENYFGYNRSELIGNKIEMLVPNAVEINHEHLRSVFVSHPTTRYMGADRNLFGLRKDGSKIPIEVTLNPIHIQNETLILTSIIDITERKKADEEIKNAKTEAERANLAKSEFLSRMSHELRTPLNSILGFTQLMGMGELNPSHRKGVDHIMQSGKHLLNLINEVLDLSRIEAGKLSVSLETVELNGIILEILDAIHPLAKENKIKIEFENVKTQQLFVKADHQKLKQVLLNIINNAIKYNNEGGSVTITATNVKNKNARISVTDTGNGIHKDELQKLFMPFQRIGKKISEVEGTGLGLAISKKLTEAMNGSIGVKSVVGKGSTFWIELPQSNGLMESHHLEVDFETMPINKTNFEGTLLYIEDNISNQQLIKQIIDIYRSNINLITNLYGKDAVKMAMDYKPNLILLDLDLPDIHGSEVLALLQKNPKTKKIPVIILSADATDTQMKKLLKAGATTYLTKPFDVIEFLKVIDEIMNDEQLKNLRNMK